MKETKFRAWNGEMWPIAFPCRSGKVKHCKTEDDRSCWTSNGEGVELMQFTGLTDINGKEIYRGDICEFDNGDRFVVECEDWLEFYVSWVGETECEDQARDFYRIEKAKVIGNKFENPELLEVI